MKLKTVESLKVDGKTVLLRASLNVPIEKKFQAVKPHSRAILLDGKSSRKQLTF